MAPGSCSCLLYDLANLEELTQLLSPSVEPVVKDRKHFPLSVICQVTYVFTISKIESVRNPHCHCLENQGAVNATS